jgi:hypothetical protein
MRMVGRHDPTSAGDSTASVTRNCGVRRICIDAAMVEKSSSVDRSGAWQPRKIFASCRRTMAARSSMIATPASQTHSSSSGPREFKLNGHVVGELPVVDGRPAMFSARLSPAALPLLGKPAVAPVEAATTPDFSVGVLAPGSAGGACSVGRCDTSSPGKAGGLRAISVVGAIDKFAGNVNWSA